MLIIALGHTTGEICQQSSKQGTHQDSSVHYLWCRHCPSVVFDHVLWFFFVVEISGARNFFQEIRTLCAWDNYMVLRWVALSMNIFFRSSSERSSRVAPSTAFFLNAFLYSAKVASSKPKVPEKEISHQALSYHI
jgi:hypothetical protein